MLFRIIIRELILTALLWNACCFGQLNNRPPPSERTFNSSVINSLIDDVSSRMRDRQLAVMFENCLPSTLDTTIQAFDITTPDAFVITGDIHAQWFRDSTNQVLPYIPFVNEDTDLRRLICGLIKRQTSDVLHDVYANAFNYGNSGDGHADDIRFPPMTPHVFEGKYELDSLGAVMKLAFQYFDVSDDEECFEGDEWIQAMRLIIETIKYQQIGTLEEWESPGYTFQRITGQATDTLMMSGHGAAAKRCGLSKCQFRPSDDATTLPFLIPANAMAVVELQHLSEMCTKLAKKLPAASEELNHLSFDARELSSEISAAIQKHGIVEHPKFGSVFAYEVDGFGSSYLMDDANLPSLLSLPWLGFTDVGNDVYQNTRRMILSEHNPFYFQGTSADGIGGPHVGLGFIWPMSIAMRALTSVSDEEIIECLDLLKDTTAGTNFMHESFWKDDPEQFTREWFAWANTLFGELILILATERPHLLF